MKFELIQEFPEFENVSSMTASPSEEYIFVSGSKDREFTGGISVKGSQTLILQKKKEKGVGYSAPGVYLEDNPLYVIFATPLKGGMRNDDR